LLELQHVAQTSTVQTNLYSEVNKPQNGDTQVRESAPAQEPPDYIVQLTVDDNS